MAFVEYKESLGGSGSPGVLFSDRKSLVNRALAEKLCIQRGNRYSVFVDAEKRLVAFTIHAKGRYECRLQKDGTVSMVAMRKAAEALLGHPIKGFCSVSRTERESTAYYVVDLSKK